MIGKADPTLSKTGQEENMIEIGSRAPDFTLDSHLGVPFRMSDYRGKRHLILVFYPLDWTPT